MNEKLSKEERDLLFKHLKNIWDITPDEVQHRFLKEFNCILCNECTIYISQLQKEIIDERTKKNGSDLQTDV